MPRAGRRAYAGTTARLRRSYVRALPPSIDDEIVVPGPLGGLTRHAAPVSGLRPTIRFAVASALTLAWVAFSVWVSQPWREELELAIGPLMAWVIPALLAYIPGLVIGFMISGS